MTSRTAGASWGERLRTYWATRHSCSSVRNFWSSRSLNDTSSPRDSSSMSKSSAPMTATHMGGPKNCLPWGARDGIQKLRRKRHDDPLHPPHRL